VRPGRHLEQRIQDGPKVRKWLSGRLAFGHRGQTARRSPGPVFGNDPDGGEGADAATVLTPWRTSGRPSATRAGRAKPSKSRVFATSFPTGRSRLGGCTFTRGDAQVRSLPRSESPVLGLASRRRDGSSSHAGLDTDARP
jgi:hypothetical protein